MRVTLTLATIALLSSGSLAQDQAATATFFDAGGNEVGSVQVMPMEGGVHVTGSVAGLTPGPHGIHFHETGNCDPSTAFESAGAHFNPAGKRHGLENPQGPHAGDLPNLEASAGGETNVDFMSDLVSLDQANAGYLFDEDGTALVIHAGADDQRTDPSGNSGDRVACGVIEAAQ